MTAARDSDRERSSEALVIEQIVQRLTDTYPELSMNVVGEVVQGVHARFTHSRVREFVPLLVERRAREQLSSQAGSLLWST